MEDMDKTLMSFVNYLSMAIFSAIVVFHMMTCRPEDRK
eukprot:CAMPEP_0118852422 /NCGR_PEP_ID=MMETSP1163-20130328/1438_1 /TAXON_ID=124430 /ORGANISM="Phaeomonas parva, Strain CCMP2877" /LENGTH=37 /DNA_ID= /DNA_START= /DNA_END= /DNA_ORIENTATION=